MTSGAVFRSSGDVFVTETRTSDGRIKASTLKTRSVHNFNWIN